MSDVTYNVFLADENGTELNVILADADITEIEGATKIGDFCHPCTEDPLGFSENHALAHHIRDMLYHLNRKGEPAFWPDNVTDMARLSITKHVAQVETEEPEDPGDDGEE